MVKFIKSFQSYVTKDIARFTSKHEGWLIKQGLAIKHEPMPPAPPVKPVETKTEPVKETKTDPVKETKTDAKVETGKATNPADGSGPAKS
jgi:hypothetical protein